jgi:hypothetical protein
MTTPKKKTTRPAPTSVPRHDHDNTAALHILLVAAMHRLGIDDLQVTRPEYEAAKAKSKEGLRLSFNGTTYRARV